MKVEIYGVDESDFRCSSCVLAKKLCNEAGIEFEFNKVVTRGADDLPEYDYTILDALVTRAKFPNRSINYPVIFVNDEIVRIKNFQRVLYEAGYDVDPE